MKLHLPCALRGALLACFALACTAPAMAANIVLEGNTDSYFIRAGGDTSYTITPSSSYTDYVLTVGTLNVCDTATLTFGDPASTMTEIRVNNLLVADKKDLTIHVAANNTLILDNVNFTGNVNYVLESGAQLVVSASDLTKGSISGPNSATVYYNGGVINAMAVNLSASTLQYWCSNSSESADGSYTSGGFMFDELTLLSGTYIAPGSNLVFSMTEDATVQFNVATGSGSIAPGSYSFNFTWNGAGTRVATTADKPSVIIDKEVDVYRDRNTAGNLYWNIQKDVTVENLQSGSMACAAELALVAMGDSDILYFAGGTLSSSSNVTLNNPLEGDGTNAIKLAPAAGTTLTFTQGDGALSNGNGLELSGGKGSTVALMNVSTAAPENITFTTDDTTLAIAGPSTLTMDAEKNTFLTTSHLSKLDGGTLAYLAKSEGDSIASLANASGTVLIDRAAEIEVGSITAAELKLSKGGTALEVGTVAVCDLTLDASYNTATTMEADTLTASGTVSVGDFTQLTAGSMVATNLTLGQGALLSGSTLVAGTAKVDAGVNGYSKAHGIAVGSITVQGNGAEATLAGMNFTSHALSTSSVNTALINVAASATRAAAPTLALGSATNTVINTATSTTIANTVFSNSTVQSTADLTLNGTEHGADTTIASTGTVDLKTVKLNSGGSITAGATDNGDGTLSGGSVYTISDEVLSVSIDKGTASASALELTQIKIDISNVKEVTDEPIAIFTDGADGVEINPNQITYRTASGLRGTLVTQPDGSLAFTLRDASDEIVEGLVQSAGSPNAAQVADALVEGIYAAGGAAAAGEMGEVYKYLCNESDATLARRQAALDALSCASVTMLADSQRHGVKNTINSLRNRVVQMGNPQGIEPETNVHGWISADGSYDDIDQDGANAGYEYQTWGGTVGMHADVGNFSFGAAISAAYGELTAHSGDNAEGNHDSQTLSLFARHQKGSWTQMGILSFGRNELDMQRRINAPVSEGESKVYTADSDMDGYTITAYYEAGYTIVLNDDATQVLQPLVSVMLTSAHMGSFSETGTIGNAGYNVEAEDYVYGTLGIGARYQIVLDHDVNDRLSFLELRAKLVQDFGDDTNEASMSFIGAPGQSFSVQGADVGSTGFQFGAGISIPTSLYTTLFADVDADIRSGATSVGGSVGVRVEF